MTYHTSHTSPPRVIPHMGDVKSAGMPCEGDLAALMIKAAKGERGKTRHRDSIPGVAGGVPNASERPMAKIRDKQIESMLIFIRNNPSCTRPQISASIGVGQDRIRTLISHARLTIEIKATSWKEGGKMLAHYEVGQ